MVYLGHHNNYSQVGSWRIRLQFPEKVSVHRLEQYTWESVYVAGQGVRFRHFNIQKTKITASSPITSWKTDGETMETMTDFILGGSKITADGDCSHEIKRCLLLVRKAMTT